MKKEVGAFFTGMLEGAGKGLRVGLTATLAIGLVLGFVAAGSMNPFVFGPFLVAGIVSSFGSFGFMLTAATTAIGAIWEGVDEYIDAVEAERQKADVKEILKSAPAEKPRPEKEVTSEQVVTVERPVPRKRVSQPFVPQNNFTGPPDKAPPPTPEAERNPESPPTPSRHDRPDRYEDHPRRDDFAPERREHREHREHPPTPSRDTRFDQRQPPREHDRSEVPERKWVDRTGSLSGNDREPPSPSQRTDLAQTEAPRMNDREEQSARERYRPEGPYNPSSPQSRQLETQADNAYSR